ncbi:MAG: cytochrome C oxidase subunit II [Bacillota bacterium]
MKKVWVTSLFLALILLLAACGGEQSGSGDSSGGTESTVELKAANWDFDKDTYTVPAGEVTFKLISDDGYHGIEIEGTDVKIDGDGTATAKLEPGEYTVKCSIPCGEGHEEMKATIVVE